MTVDAILKWSPPRVSPEVAARHAAEVAAAAERIRQGAATYWERETLARILDALPCQELGLEEVPV